METVGEKKYYEFAEKFFDTYGEGSWNSFKNKYKDYLRAIHDSKTEEEVKRAWDSFGQNVGTPLLEKNVKDGNLSSDEIGEFRSFFNAYNSPKQLGSYDEMKKNSAFAKSEWMNQTKNEKGELVDNVPVLAIVDDPAKLAIAAAELGMKPDDVKKHVLEQFDVRKKKMAAELNKKGEENNVNYRNSLVRKFENGSGINLPVVGNIGWNTAATFVAPEVTNWAKSAVITGDDSEGLGKAILKDLAFNAVSLGTGGAAGKLAGKVAGKLAGASADIVKPIVSAGVGASKDAAVELGREAASDYESVDPNKVIATFGESLMLPSSVLTVSHFGSKLPGGTRLGDFSRKVKSGDFGTSVKARIASGVHNAAVIGGARAPLNQNFSEVKKSDTLKERMWMAGFKPKAPNEGEDPTEDYEEYMDWYRKQHEMGK